MDEFATSFWLSAVLTGVAFGYVIQRGGFCLTRAISNLALMGDAGILRAYVLAMLVAVVGVHLLTGLGLVEVPVRPFRWIANILGGLLFGVGMILAGGCSGSTWYRVGEGAIGAWVILLGFALGATTANVGALEPLRGWLQSREFELRLGDAPPTLPSALGVPPWGVIAVLGAAVSGRRAGAIARALPAEDGPISTALRQRVHDPVLSLSLWVRTALFLGVVFVMTTEPSTVGALAAMGIAVVVGLAAAIPARSSGRRPARMAGSER